MVPELNDFNVSACIYIKDGNNGCCVESTKVKLVVGEWTELQFEIPPMNGVCLEEAGVRFIVLGTRELYHFGIQNAITAYLDDFDFYGGPAYSIDFSKEHIELWNALHKEISQFTYLKGIWELHGDALSGSCCDYAEAYTGGYDWKDYSFEATINPQIGNHHNMNFRVQGAIKSYALGLSPNNELSFYKNDNGYKKLASIPFVWDCGKEYTFKVEASGSDFKVYNNGKLIMEYSDMDHPYTTGQIGVSVLNGSHCHYKNFKVIGAGYGG